MHGSQLASCALMLAGGLSGRAGAGRRQGRGRCLDARRFPAAVKEWQARPPRRCRCAVQPWPGLQAGPRGQAGSRQGRRAVRQGRRRRAICRPRTTTACCCSSAASGPRRCPLSAPRPVAAIRARSICWASPISMATSCPRTGCAPMRWSAWRSRPGLPQATAALAQMDQLHPARPAPAGVALAQRTGGQAEATRARQLAAADLGTAVPSRRAAPAPAPRAAAAR